MSAVPPRKGMTIDEFFEELARPDSERMMWANGEVFAMSGGSYTHSVIKSNLTRRVGNALDGRPCRVLDADMMVHVATTELFAFPDLSVVCGEKQLGKRNGIDYLENPTLLCEVLSPSTEAGDRGLKFDHYRKLESLKEYILVDSMSLSITRYVRQGEDWLLTVFSEPQGTVRLQSLDVELSIEEIYEDVEFEAQDQAE